MVIELLNKSAFADLFFIKSEVLVIYNDMNKLIINTKNLRQNIKKAKQMCKNRLCLVAKADCYGIGIENIVPFVDDLVASYAVAKVSEGKALRDFTNKDILVLGAFDGEDIASAEVCDLTLSVYNFESLKLLVASGRNINIHIKVNSGMNRLGFGLKDLERVKDIVSKSKLRVKGIYSHIYNNLSISSTLEQKNIFDKAIEMFDKDIIKHLSSTGGIGTISGYDMTRLGIGAYGGFGYNKVVSIYSKVAQVNELTPGDKVGYDGTYVAKEHTKVATIPLGYYDGVPLALQGGYVYIGGKKCEVVGRVCMDMFMCRVDNDVKVGDIVKVLWDTKYWAKLKGTHEWEILTSLKRNRLQVVFRS